MKGLDTMLKVGPSGFGDVSGFPSLASQEGPEACWCGLTLTVSCKYIPQKSLCSSKPHGGSRALDTNCSGSDGQSAPSPLNLSYCL